MYNLSLRFSAAAPGGSPRVQAAECAQHPADCGEVAGVQRVPVARAAQTSQADAHRKRSNGRRWVQFKTKLNMKLSHNKLSSFSSVKLEGQS